MLTYEDGNTYVFDLGTMMKNPAKGGRRTSGSSQGVPRPATLRDPEEKPTRKNHYLYQSKIDLAKEILGVKTETEALDGALDLLIYGEALARGTEQMEGEEYHDVLGIAEEIPGSRTAT